MIYTNKIISKIIKLQIMQKLCIKDTSGKGEHCFCIEIDTQRGVKKCCKCNQWNVQGKDWTEDSDFR